MMRTIELVCVTIDMVLTKKNKCLERQGPNTPRGRSRALYCTYCGVRVGQFRSGQQGPEKLADWEAADQGGSPDWSGRKCLGSWARGGLIGARLKRVSATELGSAEPESYHQGSRCQMRSMEQGEGFTGVSLVADCECLLCLD